MDEATIKLRPGGVLIANDWTPLGMSGTRLIGSLFLIRTFLPLSPRCSDKTKELLAGFHPVWNSDAAHTLMMNAVETG